MYKFLSYYTSFNTYDFENYPLPFPIEFQNSKNQKKKLAICSMLPNKLRLENMPDISTPAETCKANTFRKELFLSHNELKLT